jgi:PAS domain S-box-containing protein
MKKNKAAENTAVDTGTIKQKKTTAKLTEKKQLQLFVEYSPIAIAMFDTSMNYIVASKKWIEVNELQDTVIKGKNLFDPPPNISQRWQEIHKKCLAGKIEKCDEDYYTKSDGSLAWVKWVIHPWFKESDVIGGVMILLEEITDRKELDLKFQSLIENSSIGVYILQNDKLVYVNPRFAQIFNYSSYELLNAIATDKVFHKDDVQIVRQQIKNQLNKVSNPIHYEARGIKKDGTVIWLEIYGSSTLYKGSPAIIGTLQDITERKNFENTIILEKDLSDTLIKGLPGIFYLADKNGQLIQWNRNLEIVTGCKQDELSTKKTIDFVDPSQIDLILNKRAEAFLNGKASAEINLINKNGQRLIYYIKVMPIRYKSEECVLGIGIDFTDKKAAEQSLIDKNAEIKKRVKELQCLYRLSEIANNPKYTIESTMQEFANIIPSAYQYPDITCAHIELGDTECKSESFKETAWKQESVIEINGEPAGMVKAYYTKEMPQADEGPFQKEERFLIDSIADILGNAAERKLAEKEIIKLGRLYQFISATNEMMLKAENSETIFKEACQIAVKYGNFRMAWIGIYNSETKNVTPVAFAGNEDGYLKNIKISTNNYTLEHGLTRKATRKRRYHYCNDIANDPVHLPWREEALKRGYRSSISLPIITNSKLIAVFTLYMAEPFFFTQEECKLLIEVTENIAYALEKIELRKLQKRAEADLKESEEKFRILVEGTLVGVFILQEGKFIYVNPEFEKIIGFSKDALLNNISFEKLIHEDDLKTIWKKYLARMAGEKPPAHYTLRAVKSDGTLLHVDVIISSITFKSKPAIIGTIIDISEQVEEEKRISKAVTDAQENERQQISMELHDNVKQIMAATLLNVDFIPMTLDDQKTTLKIINNVKKYLQDAIEEIRRISHQLAPAIDPTLSLKQMLESLVDTMNVSNTINVSYRFKRLANTVSNDIQLAIYRILQEQFTNILKHANATDVTISLNQNKGNFVLTIHDNGIGFDTSIKKSGIGLENIKRRIQAFNGNLVVQSAPGKGCTLVAEIPVE